MLYPLSYGRMFFSCAADASAGAEARGFEPPVAFEGDNSLAVSPIRPLWHASSDVYRRSDSVHMGHGTRQSAFERPINWASDRPSKIGRASCRERAEHSR